MRTPKRYRAVTNATYLMRSLKTDSESTALMLVPLVKQEVLNELDLLLGKAAEPVTRANYDAMLALARTRGIELKLTDQIASGPIEALLERIEMIAGVPPASPLVPVSLGIELPETSLLEIARDMETLRPDDVAMKNQRQIDNWNQRWLRAANAFVDAVGDKPIKEITVDDAHSLRIHWENKIRTEKLTSDYAKKHIGHVKQMIAAFHAQWSNHTFVNPFEGVSITSKPAHERKQKEKRKPEFDPKWIKDVLLTPGKLNKLNDEARDIIIICAETGCRGAEVFDLPESAIQLHAEIPHIKIFASDDDEQKRDIKTASSVREVPLLGAALEAMKRHPEGFPRYRGKTNFWNVATKFLRENNLMPSSEHQISSLRHSYESRMIRADLSNDERAFMMGHSLKRVRGREVYGDEADLKIRALFAEMIVFPTETYKPRSRDHVRKELTKLYESRGFRTI